jgi:hypothetical protein
MSRGSVGAPTSQAEVTRAWEPVVAVEAARIMVDLAAETSAQVAGAAWENDTTPFRGAEDWAALAERESQERDSRVEAESAALLASARQEAEGIVRSVALLEGELAEVHQAREMAEENSQGLSNAAVDVEWWREESEREFQ